MASSIEIINAGLRKLGEPPITTRTDQSPQARIANATYDSIRNAMLRETPWNFATKRTRLAADASTPAWGYDRQFPLPADFLRLTDVSNASDSEWRLENGKILTDLEAPLDILYVAQVSESDMDISFQEALAARCAFEWAETLSQTDSVKQTMGSQARIALQRARAADGQEDRQRKLGNDSFITSRFV
jgi:hypothetical protein